MVRGYVICILEVNRHWIYESIVLAVRKVVVEQSLDGR